VRETTADRLKSCAKKLKGVREGTNEKPENEVPARPRGSHHGRGTVWATPWCRRRVEKSRERVAAYRKKYIESADHQEEEIENKARGIGGWMSKKPGPSPR